MTKELDLRTKQNKRWQKSAVQSVCYIADTQLHNNNKGKLVPNTKIFYIKK